MFQKNQQMKSWKDRKWNIDMGQSILTIKYTLNKPLVMKAPKVNDNVLQPGGKSSCQLNHDNPYWPKPVTYLVFDFRIYQRASGDKVIA